MKRLALRLSLVAIICGVLAFTALHASSDNPDHVAAFRSTNQCAGCDLKNARLGGIQAPNAQLINADLSDATLYGANLRGADLTGAILDRTNLAMADLTGAIGAILGSAITDQRTTCPDGSAGPCR
jgi:uncharacterized protein YjbI with pentapeptide repeats